MADLPHIQECVTVTGGDIEKLPWIIKPDSYKKVEDTLFVKLSKVDIGFAMFACGKGDLSNIECLNYMLQMRYNATLKHARVDQHPVDHGSADDLGRANQFKHTQAATLFDQSR